MASNFHVCQNNNLRLNTFTCRYVTLIVISNIIDFTPKDRRNEQQLTVHKHRSVIHHRQCVSVVHLQLHTASKRELNIQMSMVNADIHIKM